VAAPSAVGARLRSTFNWFAGLPLMPRQSAGIPATLPESATSALKKYEHYRSEDDPQQAAR